MLTCTRCQVAYEPVVCRDEYLCPKCGAIVVVRPDLDHFAALGFKAPACDVDALKTRYLELNRLLHPDRFTMASEADRKASLINVAKVNDAYRCLSDPVSRARYWLELCGKPLGSEGDGLAPELASELFEFQALAADLTSHPGDEGYRSSADRAIAGLSARVNRGVENVSDILEGWGDESQRRSSRLLSDKLAEIAYLKTAIKNLKAAMEDGCRRSVA